ncbi:hypothetical protein NPIL_519341 [Nephila pilipes]|uniref:Uncharacterized protein n=1 Tax=Nephila pilipes TaxID=299642 RepID=A0A8X6TI10_NEPPI|nr:hypothetical protein NPIL_519341 [Nephila pilipes]
MFPRCLKCAQNHRIGECTIKEKNHEPVCINCGLNHIGKWRRCQKCPKPKKAPAKETSTVATENRNKPPTRIVSENISYANIVSSNINPQIVTLVSQRSAST